MSKYGYNASPSYNYFSKRMIYCPSIRRDGLSPTVEPLFFVDKEDEDFWWMMEEFIKGMAAGSALLTRLSVFRLSIESLRSKVLMDLSSNWRVIKKSGKTVYELKHLILRLHRLSSELRKSKGWLNHSLSGAADLKMTFPDQESSYISNTLGFFESDIKSLDESAAILDKALSERLATENIYVMYQLQRRIFWLTMVGVFVAIVGLVSAWDKVINYGRLILSVVV